MKKVNLKKYETDQGNNEHDWSKTWNESDKSKNKKQKLNWKV